MKELFAIIMSGLLLASCADHKQTTMSITKEQISFPIGQRIDNPAFTGEAYLKPLISVDSVFNFPQTNVVMCPPNVKHWHGAAPNSRFAHLAAGTNPNRPAVVWTDEILSKEEYDQLPKE